MKRTFLVGSLVAALAGGGIVAAQTISPKPGQSSASPTAPSGAMMGGGMMGGGMMGGGMMGSGMCPMFGGGMMGSMTTKVDVKKIEKGVTITFTSPDAATAARLQKMAEAMRLMHEATAQ